MVCSNIRSIRSLFSPQHARAASAVLCALAAASDAAVAASIALLAALEAERASDIALLAFASTAASGATFLGLPGLTYTYGMSTIWLAFLYPVGIYLGVWICQRTVGQYGNQVGARSIPEYLGERYQSEALRISAAVFS